MFNKAGLKKQGKRLWYFLWHDDSAWSWLANVVVAFVIIRFLFYPLLGLILGTSFPIVAVVSESMEHGIHDNLLCGQNVPEFKESFDNYWDTCGTWYEKNNITKEQFEAFPLRDGFDKGDVIILWRAKRSNIEVGDILVFRAYRPQPIIHRVVKITAGTDYDYQTKGDHNSNSIDGLLGETSISEERIIGKGTLRIPYLGWLKILFVEAVRPLGINIQR